MSSECRSVAGLSPSRVTRLVPGSAKATVAMGKQKEEIRNVTSQSPQDQDFAPCLPQRNLDQNDVSSSAIQHGMHAAELIDCLINSDVETFLTLADDKSLVNEMLNNFAKNYGGGESSAMEFALRWMHGVEGRFGMIDVQNELDLFFSSQRDRWALLSSTVLAAIDLDYLCASDGLRYLRQGYAVISTLENPRLSDHASMFDEALKEIDEELLSIESPIESPPVIHERENADIRFEDGTNDQVGTRERPLFAYGDAELEHISCWLDVSQPLERDLIYQINIDDQAQDTRALNQGRRDAVQCMLDSVALSQSGAYYVEFLSQSGAVLAKVTLLHRSGFQNIYIDDAGNSRIVTRNVCSQRGYLLGKTHAHFHQLRVSGVGFASDVIKAQIPLIDLYENLSNSKQLKFQESLTQIFMKNDMEHELHIIMNAQPLLNLSQGIELARDQEKLGFGPYILIRVTNRLCIQPFVLTPCAIYSAKGKEQMNFSSGKKSRLLDSDKVKRWYLIEVGYTVGMLTRNQPIQNLLQECATTQALEFLFANVKDGDVHASLLKDLTVWIENEYFSIENPPSWFVESDSLSSSVDLASLILRKEGNNAVENFFKKYIPAVAARLTSRREIYTYISRIIASLGNNRLWSNEIRYGEVRAVLEWIEQGFVVSQDAMELAVMGENEFYQHLGLVARRLGFSDLSGLQTFLLTKLPKKLLPDCGRNPDCAADRIICGPHRWLFGSDQVEIADQDFRALLNQIHPGYSDSLISKKILTKIDFTKAQETGARLNKVNFSGVDLSGSSFAQLMLAGAKFGAADLRHADFSGAQLQGASFCNANVSGADFRGANIVGADFSGCDLTHALFDVQSTMAKPVAESAAGQPRFTAQLPAG